ncbi:13548_t:CDS:2, partial [Rhizophagus irregularis]
QRNLSDYHTELLQIKEEQQASRRLRACNRVLSISSLKEVASYDNKIEN